MKVFRAVLFTLLFIVTGYLFIDNRIKTSQIELLEENLELVINQDKEFVDHYNELISSYNDFYKNLRATRNPDGYKNSHSLYVSEDYYKKHFISD